MVMVTLITAIHIMAGIMIIRIMVMVAAILTMVMAEDIIPAMVTKQ
jgi:hypothetical protein